MNDGIATLTAEIKRLTGELRASRGMQPPPEEPVTPILDTVDDEYWEPKQAAAYLGLNMEYLMRQTYRGRGPIAVRPSHRVLLYRKRDLDAWRATWRNH